MARQRPSGPHRVTLWAYENGTLVPREVRLGLADGNVTEVVDGLPEGANVVLRVREGAHEFGRAADRGARSGQDL